MASLWLSAIRSWKRSLLLLLSIQSLTRGFVFQRCKGRTRCTTLLWDNLEQEANEEHNQKEHLFHLMESSIDDERMPSRPYLSWSESSTYWNDWGIEHLACEPSFPNSVDAVTDAALDAIVGTLCQSQRLDPNIASNAMTKSIFGYRPVRTEKDMGRIGVEMDGTRHLFRDDSIDDADATRRVALELASKLSQRPWNVKQEQSVKELKESELSSFRPVAVYFNTVKQALVASQELQTMQNTISSKHVSILSLGQDDDIPHNMQRKKGRGHRKRYNGQVDPTRGVVLVVQPTDYNEEFRPPGPAVGAVSSLQRLVARASIHQVPVVILSPRFLAQKDLPDSGLEQSGFQQSATYGGLEPPKGPTPWLMRDFVPPVYCWVGCALPLTTTSRNGRQYHGHEQQHHGHSRVCMTQSVMDEGHSWHMFAAQESGSSFKYLASTKSSAGRPTRDIIRHIRSEWT